MQRAVHFRGFVCLLGLLATTIAVAQKQSGTVDASHSPLNRADFATPSRPHFAADRLIVRFRAGKSPLARSSIHALAHGRTTKGFRTLPDLEIVQLESGVNIRSALNRYRSQADVLYAEPDYRRTLFDIVPNDPKFIEQWGLHNTGQNGGVAGADISAIKAWGLSTGSSDVVVGTIDTGVDWNHPDLAVNIFRNDGDCTDNGIDDDGNGFIDDCDGYNGAAGHGDPVDVYGHGTHVAGIIGAVGNNAEGVVGVNWNVKILTCKTDDEYGVLYDSAILSCLDYIATMKDHGLNIVATNNSYGGPFESKAITDAIREQMKRGILFVAAAGNYGLDNDSIWVYPANTDLPNILSVAATDATDARSEFSDFGRHTVHLGAPGVKITSTIPNGGYDAWDGTSMAAPYVTGTAALLKAHDPALSWVAIKNRLLAGGDPLKSLSATISGRRLNAYGAMTCAGQEVLARLQPERNDVYVAIGETVTFSVLHILCSEPAGELTLSVGHGPDFTLHDDGQNGDEAAGDGVYTARWAPPAAGRYTATFSNGESVTINVLKPYTFSNADYNWRTIAGTYVPVDWWYYTPIAITAPFPVRFGGLAFDHLAIDTYGTLEMLGPQEDVGWGVFESGFALPTVFADTLVAPMWDNIFDRHDLDPAQGVYWDVLGQEPNRELVIEWRGFHHYTEYSFPGAAGTVTFQVVFSESTDDVIFNYADTTFGNESFDNGASASVGIQISKGVGMQYGTFSPVLFPDLAVRWTTANVVPTNIEIIWPNGGEIQRPGDRHPIWWNATGPAATDFRIELLKGDAINSVLTTSVSAASGSFDWKIPLDQAPGSDYKIRLVSNSDPTVTHTSAASFTIDNVYVLAIWPGNWGTGTVVSSPAGINCHEICHAAFAAGTTLTLSATPDPGNYLGEWVGPCIGTTGMGACQAAGPLCTGTGPCVVTMTNDVLVFADFVPGAPPPPNFNLSALPPVQTVNAGASAQFTIAVEGQNGFSGDVRFACNSGLPAYSSCSFTPQVLNVGETPVSTTLSISTTAASFAMLSNAWRPILAFLLPLFGLISCVPLRHVKRWAIWRISILVLQIPLFTTIACGGGENRNSSNRAGTPAGTYNIAVTATSASASHTRSVTLTVR